MDLSATYTRLSAEIALYAEDGANLMIKHGWWKNHRNCRPSKADQSREVDNHFVIN